MKIVNQVEMGERYKNWMEALARWLVIAINSGKDTAGEAYLKRLEEEFYNSGQRGAKRWRDTLQLGKTTPDCIVLGKIMDNIDDSYANWWEGYVENSQTAFEKHIQTCPVAKVFGRAPELCDRLIIASARGMFQELNPKADIIFDRFLSKGDDTCHYRVEIKE